MKMKTFFKFVQVCVVYILVDGIVQFDAIRFQHIPKPNILKVLPLRPRKLQKQVPHPVPKQIPLHRQQKHPFALQDDENVHHNYNSLERKIHPHVQAGHNAVSGQGKHHPAYSNLNNNHIPQIHQHPHLARSENHQAPVHHELQNHHNLDGKVDHDLKKNHIPALVHHEMPNVGIEANHVPLSHQYRDHQVQRNLHNHIQAPGLDKLPNRKVHLGPPPPKQFTFLDRPTFYQRVRKYFSKTTAESSSPPISTTIVVTNSTTARTWLQYSLTQTSQKTRHPFKIVDDGPTKRVSSEYVPLEESKTTPKRISSEEIPLISDEKTTKHISSEYVPLESFGKTTKPISSEYVPLVSDEKTTKQVSSEYVPLVSDEAATTKHISSEYVTNEPPKTAIISEEFVSAEDTKTVTKKAKRDDSSSYDSDGEKRRLNRLSTFSYELDFYDAGTLFNLTEDEWKIWDENREQIMREAFPPEELTPVRNLTFDEVVRNFFNYEKIEDKYMPFYKWYYRILTNPQYMKELYNRTVVEELDYKNLSKYTPFPIPEPNQRYFMFINYLEDEIKKEQEEEKLAKQEKQQVEEEWDKILQDDVDEDVVDDDIVDESLSLALPSTPPPLRLQTTPPPQITIQQPDPPTSSTGAEQSRKPTRDKPLHLQEPGLRRQSPPNLKQQQNDQNAQAPAQAKTAQRMQTNKPPLVQQIKDSKENLFG